MEENPAADDAFIRFADTAEAVRGTTKRLEKAALLAAYFDPLPDRELAISARYFAGYTFPMRDQRTTNIGGSALTSAILAVTGVDETWLRERLVARGDVGDAAFDAFESLDGRREPSLTLLDVSTFMETLAATGGAKKKLEMVVGLLGRASPLEAKYLAKLISGDLRIGLQEGAVEDAIARWVGKPVGEIQWANMLMGDVGETAILARAGRLDTARMRLFHPLKFMLATAAAAAADLADVERQMGAEFAVEDKYDGIRAQAHVAPDLPESGSVHGVVHDGVRVALFSRTLDEVTESFPDLVAPLAALGANMPREESAGLILDGEILPMRGDRILPFLELQKRLGRKTLTADILESVPVAFVAYDLLYGDGAVRLNEPFDSRRAMLERAAAGADGNRVRITPSKRFTDIAGLDAEFDAARARGNEGLMVKDPRSTYKPGRRGREWLKIKRAMATLDVVVTAVEVGNGRRNNLLSDYTFAVRASEQDPTLLNVGKAYSGLTDAELATMSEWFRAHTIQEFAHGKVRTVEPKVVLEVTFDLVQPSSRHKSGFALRFPRILRIRNDKPPEEIDTLETVRRLAEESQRGPADPAES
jgi:DNA ligase-1